MTTPFAESTSVRATGDWPVRGNHRPGMEPQSPCPRAASSPPWPSGPWPRSSAIPARSLRTLHTTFAAQVADGPVTVDVELLRRGRSMSHLRAEVANPGSPPGPPDHGDLRIQPTGVRLHRPPAPGRGASRRRTARPGAQPPPPGVEAVRAHALLEPVWSRVAAMTGHAPWEEYVPDRAERVLWYRFDETPLLDDGTVDPFALVVLADTMPGAVGERVGPRRAANGSLRPSTSPCTCSTTADRTWVLAHNRARFAGDGYASADMALWDCGEDGGDRAPPGGLRHPALPLLLRLLIPPAPHRRVALAGGTVTRWRRCRRPPAAARSRPSSAGRPSST